jgi:hypothetical protein
VYVDWDEKEGREEIMLESRRRIFAPKSNEGMVNERAGNTSERGASVGSDEK